jgi:hypothetical protein
LGIGRCLVWLREVAWKCSPGGAHTVAVIVGDPGFRREVKRAVEHSAERRSAQMVGLAMEGRITSRLEVTA